MAWNILHNYIRIHLLPIHWESGHDKVRVVYSHCSFIVTLAFIVNDNVLCNVTNCTILA